MTGCAGGDSPSGEHGYGKVKTEYCDALIKMVKNDELAELFRQIVIDDFGLDAALEMFGGD